MKKVLEWFQANSWKLNDSKTEIEHCCLTSFNYFVNCETKFVTPGILKQGNVNSVFVSLSIGFYENIKNENVDPSWNLKAEPYSNWRITVLSICQL